MVIELAGNASSSQLLNQLEDADWIDWMVTLSIEPAFTERSPSSYSENLFTAISGTVFFVNEFKHGGSWLEGTKNLAR